MLTHCSKGSFRAGVVAGGGAVPVRVVVKRAPGHGEHPGTHHQSSASTPPSTPSLPFTGAPIDALLTASLVLGAVGAALIAAVRRKGTFA
jgi:hypothetical protein